MFQPVASSVSSDNTAHLPKSEVVEELPTAYPYLAHEQLIYVVGGG